MPAEVVKDRDISCQHRGDSVKIRSLRGSDLVYKDRESDIWRVVGIHMMV